tara:strand:+ start:173 stop:421 length:249 start_codon:yes stop_codon:yes gene_type:complete
VRQQYRAQNTQETGTEEKKSRVGFRQILSSVFAAALGVQSSKNRDRDFKQGSAGAFLIAGLLFTVLFIVGVITVVQVVIANN